METVWKQFRIQLGKVSMRSISRALLNEKCGFVGCEKIENLELETVRKQWKRFGNSFGNSLAKLFPPRIKKASQ